MPETIVGSVGVQLVPSAKGFSEKAKALLRGLTVDVVLNVQDAKAKAELDEATKPREAKIEADADTAKANAELDEAAHTREATINANVDSGGSGERLNELARNRTAHINTDVGGGGFGLLTTAVLGLGPALVPVTAAVGGLGAALGAGIVGGAGGATVYGFLTGLAIKNTEKQLKAIAQLQKKVTADRLTLAQATTKAGKKSAMAQLAADTKSYKQALDLLSPAQHRFMADQAALKTAFTQFSSKNGNALFGPVNAGLRTLTHLLPAASPLVKAVSFSLRGLVDQVDHWAKSSGPSKVAKFLANLAAPSITNIGQTLGNVAKGIGGMIRAAAPLGTKVLKSIEGWSEKFAASKHNGFKSFLDYVQKVGPQVASTASSV
ncbi:MAG: hypothetical protein ACRDRN_11515, partial [Sciscionella sp.]